MAARLAAAGGVDAVLSSPLRRTRQTADAVAAGLGLDVREADGFRECAFGEWEGLTFTEVREGWPKLLASWLGDATVRPPGGESFDDVRRQVKVARDKVLARFPERTVLVVTHVTPIKLLVREALGAPMTALYRMELSPATRPRSSGTPVGGLVAPLQRRRPPALAEPLGEHLVGVLARVRATGPAHPAYGRNVARAPAARRRRARRTSRAPPGADAAAPRARPAPAPRSVGAGEHLRPLVAGAGARTPRRSRPQLRPAATVSASIASGPRPQPVQQLGVERRLQRADGHVAAVGVR